MAFNLSGQTDLASLFRGVTQAGFHHWSMVVECFALRLEQVLNLHEELAFEVACDRTVFIWAAVFKPTMIVCRSSSYLQEHIGANLIFKRLDDLQKGGSVGRVAVPRLRITGVETV